MKRTILLIAAILWSGPAILFAQTPRNDSSPVMKELLAKPAPTPRQGATGVSEDPASKLPANFFYRNNPPRDDAPLDHLLLYWGFWGRQGRIQDPSDKVKQRLLEEVSDPEKLSGLLTLLPKTEAAAEKLKELYDKTPITDRFNANSQEAVKVWLLYNSTYFLDELRALANQVKDNEHGDVAQGPALAALAKLNWEAAEPLVRNLANSPQLRSAALAVAVSYHHAIREKDLGDEERHRNRLKLIASDRSQPASARFTAIHALSVTEWSNRDQWYLSLFEDETLLDPEDNGRRYAPLRELFSSNLEKWTPIMARLAESKDLTVRSAAASCLLSFHIVEARRDTLLPLLPWLSNPSWFKNEPSLRVSLMRTLARVDMPESVPGLIWIVENETRDNRSNAAQTLARYKDPRAVPALRRALAQEHGDGHRDLIIKGLIDSQGLTQEEQIQGLEAYALKRTTPEGREEVERDRDSEAEPREIPVSIGRYLAGLAEVPDWLARAVLFQAESLKKTSPAVANQLIEISHGWQGRQVNLDMINRIENGSADANMIVQALERREKLRESAGPELHALLAAGGSAPGISAVLLNDESIAQDILAGKDRQAQIALLACSRLVQMALPIELVGPLLNSKDALLFFAAERYLLAEDSPEARELLWQRHPNEAFITGWLEPLNYLAEDAALFDKVEKKLRAELFEENGPLEIYALVGDGDNLPSTTMNESQILRVYADKVVYTHYTDLARYREWTVTRAEVDAFKSLVLSSGITDEGPNVSSCYHGCESAEFLSLIREKGRRVVTTEKPEDSFSAVVEGFGLLARGTNVKTIYHLETEIKGLELLYADETLPVRDVWQQGADIRLFVERPVTDEEVEALYQSESASAEQGELAIAERRRKRLADNNARFSWRTLINGKAGSLVGKPQGYLTLNLDQFSLTEQEAFGNISLMPNMLTRDTIIIARNFDGLWKQVANTTPVRVSTGEGGYQYPVVMPNGNWVVAAKVDTDWSLPNYVVRINLRTGREFRVKVEPADALTPIMFLPLHNKVLLYRARSEFNQIKTGPERPEHYLLNPETGDVQLGRGEFAPLLEPGKRFLQPTENANEFWTAIPNHEKNQTQVGRYNLKDFSFKSILVLPHISFDSRSMWVDAKSEKLYVVYNGELLRLPFQSSAK